MQKKIFIVLLLFTSFFIQTFELVDDIWGHVVLYIDYTTRTNLKITSRFFQQLFQKNPNFLIYDFIDALYQSKDSQDDFKKIVQKCNPECFYLLLGFDCFKNKRVNEATIDFNNMKKLCSNIVTNNKCNDVKFFIPYTLIFQMLNDGTNKHIDYFIMGQKVLDDVCKFFNYWVSSGDFYIIYISMIRVNKEEKIEKNKLLEKALSEENLNVVFFILNTFTTHDKKHLNLLEKAESYKQLKILAQANVSMYKKLKYNKVKHSAHLAEITLCAKKLDKTRALFKLLFERGEKAQFSEFCFLARGRLKEISNEYWNKKGILPYLLENQASDIILSLFQSDFSFKNHHMVNATSSQIKEIFMLLFNNYGKEALLKIKDNSFLNEAIKQKDIGVVKFLLEKGFDINEPLYCRISNTYPPIYHALNDETGEIFQLFIDNIVLLKKGQIDSFNLAEPYNKDNLIKLIKNNYFCEDIAFDLLSKSIELNNRNLYTLIFDKFIAKYELLSVKQKRHLFKEAVSQKNKEIISLFLKHGFNMFEGCDKHENRFGKWQFEIILSSTLKFIDDELIIENYKKHKNNITLEEKTAFLLEVNKNNRVNLVNYLSLSEEKASNEQKIFDNNNKSIVENHKNYKENIASEEKEVFLLEENKDNKVDLVDYLSLSEEKAHKEQKFFDNNELKNILIDINNQYRQCLRFIE